MKTARLHCCRAIATAEYRIALRDALDGADWRRRLTAARRPLYTDRARAAGDAPDFSRRIRVGVPGVEASAQAADVRKRST